MPRPGLCGSTTIWMILRSSNIKVPLWFINLYTHKWWWGVTPQIFTAFISRYFSKITYQQDSSIEEIIANIKAGNIVVINWMDNGDGHWSIVSDYKDGIFEIVDTSRERDWRWYIDKNELDRRWYDAISMDGSIIIKRLIICIDPSSSIYMV
jgi:hypothetical protein